VPSVEASAEPSAPSVEPLAQPPAAPSAEPSAEPSTVPSSQQSEFPTILSALARKKNKEWFDANHDSAVIEKAQLSKTLDDALDVLLRVYIKPFESDVPFFAHFKQWAKFASERVQCAMWPTGASQYATINNIILPVFLRYTQLSAVHDHRLSK
jgi:hypothetical protein